MTILQTLITKREPIKGEKTNELKGDSNEKFDRNNEKGERVGLKKLVRKRESTEISWA